MPLPPPTIRPVATGTATDLRGVQTREFRPRRRYWPGLLGVAIIVAGITAAVVANYYDGRTLGSRVDATIGAAESTVAQGVDDLRSAASGAAQDTANAADRVAAAIGDTAITAAVKTALAADPSLSAVKIDVSTTQGTVLLEGPAPDAKSRQRAEVLALAPSGVVRVENRLAVRDSKMPAPAPARPMAAAPAPAPARPVMPTPAPARAPAPAPAPAMAPAAAPEPTPTPTPAPAPEPMAPAASAPP